MLENIRFQKDEEFIEVKDGKYFVNINMSTQETEENILIDLPSLDIHSYASRKDKIQQEIHDACLSFIHHWIKLKGEVAFTKHMKSLGFKKKSIEAAIEPTVFASRESRLISIQKNKRVKKYSEEFELA